MCCNFLRETTRIPSLWKRQLYAHVPGGMSDLFWEIFQLVLSGRLGRRGSGEKEDIFMVTSRFSYSMYSSPSTLLVLCPC
jgi:hypothetical protein